VSVVANPSVTGATTAQMIGIGVGPITASHPDVMTVMLGVNDEFQGHTTGQFAADYYQALGDAIKITGSPSRVLAVDIPDYAVTPFALQVGPPGPIAARIELFNRVLRSVASLRGVQVVSVFGISRHDGAAELANDGLHPSCSQLAQWARHIGAVAFRAWRHFAPRSS
jgi:lysophospholipase L1-like esterase